MKFQRSLILGIAFALIVAIFAVINVEPITVHYLFGTARWPLILVILGSVFMGGVIIGSVGIVRIYVLQREIKQLEKRNVELENEVALQSGNKPRDTNNDQKYKKTAPDSIE